jgi:hypothetical protein
VEFVITTLCIIGALHTVYQSLKDDKSERTHRIITQKEQDSL